MPAEVQPRPTWPSPAWFAGTLVVVAALHYLLVAWPLPGCRLRTNVQVASRGLHSWSTSAGNLLGRRVLQARLLPGGGRVGSWRVGCALWKTAAAPTAPGGGAWRAQWHWDGCRQPRAGCGAHVRRCRCQCFSRATALPSLPALLEVGRGLVSEPLPRAIAPPVGVQAELELTVAAQVAIGWSPHPQRF